jgi:hypothetical protein
MDNPNLLNSGYTQFPLEGITILACEIFFQRDVYLYDGEQRQFSLRLSGLTHLYSGSDRFQLDPTKGNQSVCSILLCLGKTIVSAMANSSGNLEIRFHDETVLTIEASEDYDTWELAASTGGDDWKVECAAGGDLVYL